MTRLAPFRAVAAILLAVLAAAPLSAQSVRVRSTTTARYVGLRPILYDADSAAYVPQDAQAATPLTQDFEVNAWGMGVSGLRAYGLFRFRGSLGSDQVWPRYGDHFDAIAAYLEYERGGTRVRLGRQQKASALGFFGYDGLSASIRPAARVRVEAYGGLGLARGYLEPVNSRALRALDPFAPSEGTYLVGASMLYAPRTGSSLSAIYQREVLTDGAGLVSERVALDAGAILGSALHLTGSAEFDLARHEWGKSRAAASLFLGRVLMLSAEAFRYVPTLELTTIWGVFGPEAHWGHGGGLEFTPWRSVALWGRYAERRYEKDSAAVRVFGGYDLPDRSRDVTAGLRLSVGTVRLEGSYSLQLEYGGEQSGGDGSLSVAPVPGWRVGLRGTAFQRDGEFRVADGTVYGAGIEVRGRLFDRFDVRGDVMRFLHRDQQRVPTTLTGLDWNQTRATIAVDWTFGTDTDRRGGTR